jgi:dipeptidyl aminopeptidase/acylaminoacyl peptidase
MRRWRVAVACVGFLLAQQAATAHPASFTLDEVMQAPFPSDLLAAPRGRMVAWVFDARSCRNVWIADPTSGVQAHAITTFAEEGFDIGDLAWSADTKAIAFTRGGTLDDEAPTNVGSVSEGPVPREVWRVPTTGGPARKVGAGHSPSFSPDGSLLLFLDKKRILTVAASGAGEIQPLLVDEGNEGNRRALLRRRAASGHVAR